MRFIWYALDSLFGPMIGGPLAALALAVGVVGLALWAGRSRNRHCERKGWRHLGRF